MSSLQKILAIGVLIGVDYLIVLLILIVTLLSKFIEYSEGNDNCKIHIIIEQCRMITFLIIKNIN